MWIHRRSALQIISVFSQWVPGPFFLTCFLHSGQTLVCLFNHSLAVIGTSLGSHRNNTKQQGSCFLFISLPLGIYSFQEFSFLQLPSKRWCLMWIRGLWRLWWRFLLKGTGRMELCLIFTSHIQDALCCYVLNCSSDAVFLCATLHPAPGLHATTTLSVCRDNRGHVT